MSFFIKENFNMGWIEFRNFSLRIFKCQMLSRIVAVQERPHSSLRSPEQAAQKLNSSKLSS